MSDPKFIIKTVANYYGLSESQITGPRRTKTIFSARLLTIKILRNVLHMSFTEIAEVLNRDPTAIQKVIKRERYAEAYGALDVLYKRFKKAIESTPIYLTEV